MAGLEWNDGLVMGDSVIDDQHREICELTRRLADVVEQGAPRAETEQVLEGLMRYVRNHFADEEALMARLGYPGLDRQRAQHDEYRTTAARMTTGFIEGRVSAPTVLEYMLAWWHDHICGEDGELAAWVRELGERRFDA